MKVIALANQKGGVAKSTTTFNIATIKAQTGKNVLMVDLDPQSSLTYSCGLFPSAERKGIIDILDDEKCKPLECVYTIDTLNSKKIKIPNLFLAPSYFSLSQVELPSNKVLKEKLKVFEDYFDYCFIDCPPFLSDLMINALFYADEVIIPFTLDYLSYAGTINFVQTILGFKETKYINKNLKISGLIPCIYEKDSKTQTKLLERAKEEVNSING